MEGLHHQQRRRRPSPWHTVWNCRGCSRSRRPNMRRCIPYGLGGEGSAGIQHRAQAGLLHRGELSRISPHDLSFSRSFERHLNERPYPRHDQLPVPHQDHEGAEPHDEQLPNALTRGFTHSSKVMQDRDGDTFPLEACPQFEFIINDSGFAQISSPVRCRYYRHGKKRSIIEKYFAPAGGHHLPARHHPEPGEMRIGDNFLCLHTLSDPRICSQVSQRTPRYERLSTDRSDCRLSLAAPIGKSF